MFLDTVSDPGFTSSVSFQLCWRAWGKKIELEEKHNVQWVSVIGFVFCFFCF